MTLLTRCKEDHIFNIIEESPQGYKNIIDVNIPGIVKIAEKSVEPRLENQLSETKFESSAGISKKASITPLIRLPQNDKKNIL